MAFRGVLLQLIESESDDGFRVVAPDAELALPPRPVSAHETFLTKWSQQKLVVTDAVTHKLLQVTRLATVALQREDQSLLWGVTASFVPPEARTVGAAPLESYVDVPQAVKKTHVVTPGARREDTASLAAAVASPSVITKAEPPQGRTLRSRGGSEPPTRICYCFHFSSDFGFQLFSHTLEAFVRMERFALLHSSVVMEMEISRELKKSKVVESNRLQVALVKAKKRQESKTKEEKKVAPVQPKMKATTASTMICILCRLVRKPDAPEYPKHPFVLKDGKGEFVHICKVCLQRVLKERLETPPVAKKGDPDNYCGLCALSTEKLATRSIKVCAHNLCTRSYCLVCIDKLVGKAQAHKVWRTKNWWCPNCSTDDDDAHDSEEINGGGAEVAKVVPVSKQKKRKRRNAIEESTADEDEPEPSKLTKSTCKMQPIDYAVTYFKFLLKREVKDEFEESEDVCFCCKDGGDVIECDWKGMNGAFARCPKVYHEDCLGYEVPEGKTWVCPRHRCQDCGIIAQFSCRFCVTSYCQDHLPKEVKRLGHATKDIPTSNYVMCPRCNQQAQDALKQKKIGSDLHSKLLRRRR
ncbi:Histone lysine N methyltransferase [Phytophthora megakarya]|uniref:Histone lysine N methyltransferase n=1 Tax=Phytophthora megakarya TaxID=4795 RepID=A0A225VC25_9STRA|nr:Histone lysine N methyltransferase [Phytophthora megakarya]